MDFFFDEVWGEMTPKPMMFYCDVFWPCCICGGLFEARILAAWFFSHAMETLGRSSRLSWKCVVDLQRRGMSACIASREKWVHTVKDRCGIFYPIASSAFCHTFRVPIHRSRSTIFLPICRTSRSLTMALSPRLVASRFASNIYNLIYLVV